MKKVYVALVTPFQEDGRIDFKQLETLVLRLIKEGVDGFIVCGTTAESPTLSEEEKFALLERVISLSKGAVEIYFGCGTNDTLDTLRMCKKAANYPIDGLLLVTPYYNKPSQDGLFEHYCCIARNVDLPIMLYQVESRCHVTFALSTLKKLTHACSNIRSLKYASKDMETAKLIRQQIPTLDLYCGDDAMIKECDDISMNGVVSVIAHIAMPQFIQFYKKAEIEYDYYFKRLSYLLFLESSPVGIKMVLAKQMKTKPILRLPLVLYNPKNTQLLNAYFDKS